MKFRVSDFAPSDVEVHRKGADGETVYEEYKPGDGAEFELAVGEVFGVSDVSIRRNEDGTLLIGVFVDQKED